MANEFTRYFFFFFFFLFLYHLCMLLLLFFFFSFLLLLLNQLFMLTLCLLLLMLRMLLKHVDEMQADSHSHVRHVALSDLSLLIVTAFASCFALSPSLFLSSRDAMTLSDESSSFTAVYHTSLPIVISFSVNDYTFQYKFTHSCLTAMYTLSLSFIE